jgi:translocation and assembly module TamB
MNAAGSSGDVPNGRKLSSWRPSRRLIRIVLWADAAVGAVLVLVAAIVLLLGYSPFFHGYLIGLAERQVNKRFGLNLHLQNFAVHLSRLSVDLYGIKLDGAKSHPNPPLLQVQHMEVSARIISVLGRKWYLQSLEIDRPVVQIFVDKNGISNIPTIKSSGEPGNNNAVFDLGIRHAVLKDGAVYYNNQPAPMAADLSDLAFRSAFDNTRKLYAGDLRYGGGNLRYGDFNPARHGLNASFRATPSEFDLQPVKLVVADSTLTVWASVKNYDDPQVDAHYDATIDGGRLGNLIRSPYIPAGLFRSVGELQLHRIGRQSRLQALMMNGWLSSRELDLESPELRVKIRNVSARYGYANGRATVEGFRADTLGGTVAAGMEMAGIVGSLPQTRINADLRGVSLADLLKAFPAAESADHPAATGRMDATVQVTWGNKLADLVAHADASLNGKLESKRPAAAGSSPAPGLAVLPIEGAIQATYDRAKQQVSFVNSSFHAGQTELSLNGVASKQSSLAVHAQLNDLREVATLVSLFETPTASGMPPSALALAGRATFDGNVSGAVDTPRVTGKLAAEDLQWNGTTWKSLRTDVDVSPSHVGLTRARIQAAGTGRIRLTGCLGLTRWHFEKTNPVQLELGITQISLGTLMDAAGKRFSADGIVNGNLRLHGSLDKPDGNGTVLLTKAAIDQQPVQTLRLSFTGSGDEVHSNFSLLLSAGSVQGRATIRPHEQTYTAQIMSDGIRLQELQLVRSKKVPVTGTVQLRATGEGSFDNPQVTALAQVPSLAVQKQTFSGVKLQMNLANHVANAALESTAVNAAIEAKAKVQLTGDYLTDASVDTHTIPLAPLLAIYAPNEALDLTGQTEVHATLHGPLKERDELEAHVAIPRLTVDYNNQVQLTAPQPIHADFKSGILTLQPAAIRGTDTDLRFQGAIPTAANAPMRLQLLGTLNLALVQALNSDLRSSGELKFNINSNGPVSANAIGGEIDIVDANLASATMPIALQHGNGALTLTSDRVNIRSFEGTLGGGKVAAQGGMAFRPGVNFDLGISANGVRILYPQGLRETASANLRFAGTTQRSLLSGTVDVSDMAFTPGFDLSSFISQFTGGVAAPPAQGFAQNVALNIAGHTPNDVNLVSRTMSVGGSANVQVRGTLADPVVLGRVNLTSGDMIFNGDRFVLNGGTVQFVNPTVTEPSVNLNLSTTIQQYNIAMRFNGPVDQMQTSYSSDPALPTADIINLLAFGQTTEASAANPMPTNQAAESLVASQVSGQVTSRISRIAGISQLSVNPVLAGSSTQGPPGASITIQQRVTGNLFVTFTSNVASTQAQTIQGQYQVSPHVAISATRDPNGGFAVDTLIKKSW